MTCRVLAEAQGASAYDWVPKRPGDDQLTSKPHADVAGPDPRPRKHLFHLEWTEVSPGGQGLEGLGVLLEEPLERRPHVVGEIGNLRPPCRGEARKV